jgi:primosomal protein N'
MKIIQVIPIGRGISKEILSYFTALSVQAGSVVEISIKTKKRAGLVVSVQNLGTMKSEIKSLSFGMRKIERVLSASFLSEKFVKCAQTSAEFYATTTGIILANLIPQKILENIDVLEEFSPTSCKETPEKISPKYAIQAGKEERMSQYKGIIREEFAKSRSVYCCLPTIEEAKTFFKDLSKGVEPHSFLLWGGLAEKELLKTWREASLSKHPVLVVGTGACFSLCRQDIGAIIIEEESSRSYKMQRRPFLDIRTFAEMYAQTLRARFIVGDILLRLETLRKKETGEYKTLGPLQWKAGKDEKTVLINMKREEKEGEKKSRAVGDDVSEMIETARTRKKHIFLFTNRKGYAPSIICRDCRSLASCKTCNAPIAFYKGENGKENVFLCHRCRSKRNADTLCLACGSWRLDPLGIGIDRVEEELREKIPDAPIFTLDREKAKTPTATRKIISDFYRSDWGILLGTEAAFPSFRAKIDDSAILSIDSLFALPDFRINERIMHIVFKIRALTEEKLIIQTRNEDEKILRFAEEGNILDFYQSEIAEREKFKYPPFSTLIEISLSGMRTAVEREMEKVKDVLLKGYELEVFPAFIPEERGTYTLHGILKIAPGEWPKEDLKRKLAALSPTFLIRIDPESIL